MQITEDLVSSPQAAAILGVSARTVHRLIEAGTLTVALKAPGGPHGAYLIRRADVLRLAAERAA